MPEDTATTPSAIPPIATDVSDATASSIVVPPVLPNDPAMPPTTSQTPASDSETPAEVARKIGESHNVLIALSSDPSVDELAAAIGLSIYLDKLGKRATAIYSGSTPNALEFLKPEETFEPTADTLQDFVIALNKDKADHLRYKLDGDYVKIYITPYRHRLSEDDLEFSYGDFNVDLVLALDVANGIDLDSALREHGRIMHDASIINITTGNPGKFGEIEWSDKTASSVSEMVARLLYGLNSKAKIEKEEATAFLTGIVAATNRFSSAGTTPETMRLSSCLMESGANQQLISKNITPDIDNEMFSLGSPATELAPEHKDSDPTKLDIEHGNEEDVDESKEVNDVITEKPSTLLDDLKAAEESLAHAGAETTPDIANQPVKLGEASSPEDASAELSTSGNVDPSSAEPTPESSPESVSAEPSLPLVAPLETPSESTPESTDPVLNSTTEGISAAQPEKVIAPTSDFLTGTGIGEENRYGKMLEDALAGIDSSAATTPSAPTTSTPSESTAESLNNPAAMSAPAVPSNPEINGVPSINYMPMPGEEVLPPPPAPPIGLDTSASVSPETPTESTAPIEPAAPVAEPTPTPLGSQPAMQDQVYGPQASDPSAFRIPGM